MANDNYQLSVIGMSCEHCRGRVQQALEEVSGVVSVDISLETGVAEIQAEPGTTSREQLVAKVEETGYSVGSMSRP